MTRLVIFVGFLTTIAIALSLGGLKKIKTNEIVKVNSAQLYSELTKPVVVETESSEKKDAVDEVFARGEKLYQSANCVQCHGADARGVQAEEGPHLAGQFNWYLVKQLKEMKSKVRMNEKMYPFIEKLSEQDFKDLSHYLSKLEW